MTRFPTLPPNSCHEGPQPPLGRYADRVSEVHRFAGRYDPLFIAQVCALDAVAIIMNRRPHDSEDLAMIAWLSHHSARWAALAAETHTARKAA